MTQTPSLKTQTLQVGGMDCGSCAKTIEASLQQLPGMTEALVNFTTEKARVSYNPDLLNEKAIFDRIKALGYTVEHSHGANSHQHTHTHSCCHEHEHDHDHNSVEVACAKKLQVKVNGMDCGSCAKTIEVGLQQIPGVSEVSVNFATERLQLSYDPQRVSETAIYERIKDLGYTVEESLGVSERHHTHDDRHDHNHHHNHAHPVPKPTQKRDPVSWKFWIANRRGQSVILAGVGLILGLLAQYLALPVWIARAFYGIGIVVAGYPIARAGLFELRLRRADMNLLMTISVIGAVILGDWFEGALVLFLFSLGTTLQVFTFGRTRNAISALMDLTPPTATVKRGNKEVTVAVENIQIGETLTIRPGQRVALDGVVVYGTSTIDQSPITGESIPEDKALGDTVYGGTLNQTGFLEVKVTHTASDTTVAKIIHLVEQAQESRAPTQQWVDRFAEVYTPIVILIAIAITLIPPLVFAQPFHVWLYRALVMLVIACPCALVISTPVSIVSAIGAATRQGVLFKGGNALETAGRLTSLAFDKTGTLTQGEPVVLDIYNFGEESANQVLLIAASLEQRSEHPLAKAVVAKAHELGLELETPVDFTALPGKGIQANFGDAFWFRNKAGFATPQINQDAFTTHQISLPSCQNNIHELLYFVGNRRLFTDFDIPLSQEAESLLAEIEQLGQTPVLVGTTHGVSGVIALADGLRLEASEAMRQLKLFGLKHLVMLTGDRAAVAKQIAQQVGITEYQAELLPEDKLQAIQQMRRTGVVGMVGDGINDAPALAAADISFAVGGIDIALETADVVLVGSDLRRLAYAVDLSRRTVSVIQQNVVFSLVTKGLFLLLGTFGFVGLAVAVLADTGTSLLVTANGMRLFRSELPSTDPIGYGVGFRRH
ncbi:cation-transporting ATPase [Scytonema sp. HK-05]|uniref:heavy metal translocating P-type ATPase n=1 Tax=Scytonema sp. HK-05 TaxID=1137095 RepID=UPI000935D4C9|nr:heavy metal translocating P-type ATPase [Scytonema sp. HK-05]OKH59680.1 cadmium-translocating P-type ATPase [Scytonema sp. HK-05]BAY47918.1 cation-transporting ATPase [Scytonema sp. HK-05]